MNMNGNHNMRTGAGAEFPSALARLSDLARVEEKIREVLASEARLLRDIPLYLHSLGGKRIRPALCLLTARALGLAAATPALIDIAAGMELIHMATLLHDDIIDNSMLRRHHPSALAKYGMSATLLAGDFLYVRAFGLCSKLDRLIIDETERACVELTEGEVLETSLAVEPHTIESSLDICRKKTAALFRLAALSGAHLAGAGSEATRHMAAFGEHVGIAFQILDDILDVTSTKEVLGKEPGIDIRERKPSVVNVLWLRSGDPLAAQLRSPGSREEDDHFVPAALSALAASPAIAEARRLAEEFVTAARKDLGAAKASAGTVSPEISVLDALLDYTLSRAS